MFVSKVTSLLFNILSWFVIAFLPKRKVKVKVKVLVTQLCLTLCHPMDYSLPGFSVHGILQARILEWVVISFSRGSSCSRDWTWVFCIAGRFFTIWATREEEVSFNFKAEVTIHSDSDTQENKICYCFHFFTIYLPPSVGNNAMIFVFWKLSFKPTFLLSSFIKRLFSSSSLFAIRVESFAYLKLLIFHLEILIPACESFRPAFHMMYSAYKLNKQGDNIQPWHTPFSILNQFIVPCPWNYLIVFPKASFE